MIALKLSKKDFASLGGASTLGFAPVVGVVAFRPCRRRCIVAGGFLFCVVPYFLS